MSTAYQMYIQYEFPMPQNSRIMTMYAFLVFVILISRGMHHVHLIQIKMKEEAIEVVFFFRMNSFFCVWVEESTPERT